MFYAHQWKLCFYHFTFPNKTIRSRPCGIPTRSLESGLISLKAIHWPALTIFYVKLLLFRLPSSPLINPFYHDLLCVSPTISLHCLVHSLVSSAPASLKCLGSRYQFLPLRFPGFSWLLTTQLVFLDFPKLKLINLLEFEEKVSILLGNIVVPKFSWLSCKWRENDFHFNFLTNFMYFSLLKLIETNWKGESYFWVNYYLLPLTMGREHFIPPNLFF